MKILQILPELNVGGVETGTVDFANYLIQLGHDSIVVSHGGKLVEALENQGSKHITLPVHKKSIWTVVRLSRILHKIILEEKVDIVHARSRVPAWIAFFACRRTPASFITTCHGYYKNRIFSQVMGWGKLVIVPSEVIGRHMIEDFKVSTENIRCIPRSVDLNKFRVQRIKKSGQSSYVVTIVGRITPLKGHQYFLKAMARVIRNMPYVKIWIIGDAPLKKESYKEQLKLLVRRLGLKDHVKFLGNRQDVPDLLAQSDVVVLSTITQEAFGRVILEAQAAGVPVVATKVGGVVDIIDDEKTGLLVLPKDTDGMAKAIMRLLKNKDLVEALTQEAKKKLLDKFTLEHMAAKTLQVYEELLSSLNILVIKISSVGDVILSSAAFRALRKKYPKAKIFCLVGKESRQVLSNCPYFDGLIVYDSKHAGLGWIKLFKLSQKLRKCKIDRVFDFQNSRRSHLLSFLSFAKESYGFDNGKWGLLLTSPLKKYERNIPAVPHQFQLLSRVGIFPKDNTFLEFWPSEKDRQFAKALLDSEWLGNNPNIVGINIAASTRWKTKNWPIEYMARLCDSLSEKNIRVIITGVDEDKHLAQDLVQQAKSKPAILVGKTNILQLGAVIKRCRVYVTPDSAPLHIAAAVQTPVIAFFGPTDSARHIPPARKIVILDKKLSCAPCYRPHCKIATHACLKDISPEEVVAEIENLLGEEH